MSGKARWAILLSLLSTTANAQLSLRTVAVTGDPCPHSTSGGVFTQFDDVTAETSIRINNQGRVNFFAICSDFAGSTTVTEGHGSLHGYRAGDQVVGQGALNIKLVSTIDDDGDILFLGTLPNQAGIVTDRGGFLNALIMAGSPAPGTGGATFQWFSRTLNQDVSPAVGHGGQIPFFAITNTNSLGIWIQQNDSLSLTALQGSAVPNYPGEFFGAMTGGPGPTVNIHGDVAFKAGTAWVKSNGTFRRISPTANENPTDCQPIMAPSINNAGLTSYTAICAGISGQPRRIMSEAGGTLHAIATSTDSPPGLPVGTRYNLMNPAVITGGGQTVFHSSITTPDQQSRDAYFAEDVQGVLKVLVAEGMSVPGMSSDVTFDLLVRGTPSANALGHVVFGASMIGPGVSKRGIWLSDITSGSLSLLFSTGQSIEVHPGVFRQISDLTYFNMGTSGGLNASISFGSGGQDGIPTPLNDNDQFAFKATFTDGSSGIFVATIPEPASCFLLSLAAIALIKYRRSSLHRHF